MKKKVEKPENSERWLLTYSDMITLLMMFFIIMYAASNLNASKYKEISDSFKVALGGGKTLIGNEDAIDIKDAAKYADTEAVQPKNETLAQQEHNRLEAVEKKINEYIKDNDMAGSVGTSMQERGLVVSVQDTLVFDSGKAEVKPDAVKKLVEIGKMLNTIDNYIRIEGHTDNVPISNYKYEDNLSLSTERAANVVRVLIKQGGIPPKKLCALGYGEQRPVADNNTEAGRAKNRRVDIVVIDSKFNAMENNNKK